MAGDNYTVERSATIDAAPERVYAQVAGFRRWTSWSPWEELDPNLERTYFREGPGSVEGHRGGAGGRLGRNAGGVFASPPVSPDRVDEHVQPPGDGRCRERQGEYDGRGGRREQPQPRMP